MATKKKKDLIVFAFESNTTKNRFYKRLKKTSTLTEIKKYCNISRQYETFMRKKA